MDETTKRHFGFRHWIELLLGAAALVVSAVSLWVAIGTEQANRQMVAAASWPLLLADTADLPENGRLTIKFSLLNGGVGPAKLRTMEVFWKGKAYTGAMPLLESCCGLKPFTGPTDLSLKDRTGLMTGGVHNVVVLAGQTHDFLTLPLGKDNVSVWRTLDRVRHQLRFRACYCSVFDECWISTLKDLEPARVTKCPAVKTLYIE